MQFSFKTQEEYQAFVSKMNKMESLEQENQKLLTQIAEMQVAHSRNLEEVTINLKSDFNSKLQESLKREEVYKIELEKHNVKTTSFEEDFVNHFYSTLQLIIPQDYQKVENLIKPKVEHYLYSLKKSGNYLNPSIFMNQVIYPELIKFGQAGLNIFYKINENIQNFLYCPYDIKSGVQEQYNLDMFNLNSFLNQFIQKQQA